MVGALNGACGSTWVCRIKAVPGQEQTTKLVSRQPAPYFARVHSCLCHTRRNSMDSLSNRVMKKPYPATSKAAK